MKEVRVTRQFNIPMAHRLTNYDGPCKNLHGHTYKLEVTIAANKLDKDGMVIDFRKLKVMVNDNIVKGFDHSMVVNTHGDAIDLQLLQNSQQAGMKLALCSSNTTTENLAMVMGSILEDKINAFDGERIHLSRIRLWESPYSYATVVY